eukprot:4520071-Pleurochrysis_carterae.AAC.1
MKRGRARARTQAHAWVHVGCPAGVRSVGDTSWREKEGEYGWRTGYSQSGLTPGASQEFPCRVCARMCARRRAHAEGA